MAVYKQIQKDDSVKKNLLRILVLILVLVPVTLFLLHRKPEEKKRNKGDDKRKVEALITCSSNLLHEITVTGSLLAFDEVELKNEASGRIVYLHLPEGKPVRRGTLLVKLFDDDLQADLQKLQAQLKLQQQILNRQSELLKVNGISLNDYEQTQLQVRVLKAEIDAQKAQIRKTEVLAPFDGIVGLRNVSIGAVVTSSTTLATFRSNRLKLDFYVPEKYSESIRPGMEVGFTLFSGRQVHPATVMATERGIDDATRNLRVRALLSETSSSIIPGAFANISLRLGENQKAILIPTESIIPMEREKQVIIARHGAAHFVTVQTGIRKESLVEITEGLQPGDTLITSGILFLKEGDLLRYSHITEHP
jgi:membrane fusion protein, multidrug efflux system